MNDNSDIRETGDPVSSGDQGGFGRSFGGTLPRFRDLVDHGEHDVEIGAPPLPKDQLMDEVVRRLRREHVRTDAMVISQTERELTLRGEVDNARERELAGIIAEGTPGVTAVRNQLRVAT